MKKALITAKGSEFFGKVGEVVEELGHLYTINVCDLTNVFLKSDFEVLLPLSKIAKAWEEGKEIEIWDTNQAEAHWSCLSVAVFFTSPYYRIKPEPKEQIVPYTWEDRDLLRGLWVRYKNPSEIQMQIISLTEERIGVFNSAYSYKEFYNLFTHLDGTPLGKKI